MDIISQFFPSVTDDTSLDVKNVYIFSPSVTLPLFHEYLFKNSPVPFGLIRNGPISSDAPYATDEHPGPAKPSQLYHQ
jgi:hypothetical protein